MNEEIKALWLAIEREKASFLSLLDGWTESELHFQPDGQWNAVQVMDHIITSEFGTLHYLKKKTQAKAQDLQVAGEDSAENAGKLNTALQSDRKWKAPEVLPQPSDEDGFAAKSLQWSKVRQGFFAFLEELDPQYYDKQVFKHPFAGRMNLEQTLGFIHNHIVHHQHQIKRLRAELK